MTANSNCSTHGGTFWIWIDLRFYSDHMCKKKYLTNLIAIVPVFINDFLGPPYASIMREEKAITMVMATKCQIFLYTN